jgi:hypothetical protein
MLVFPFLRMRVLFHCPRTELFSGEDQTLLVGWDSFLVLNFGLYVVDGVARLHLEGDGLAREVLDEAACPFLLASPFAQRGGVAS